MGEAPAMPQPPSAQAALGLAVKARRQELGLTQEALALAGDLHQRYVSNVENGWRNPSYASLRRLATALNISASELVARAERMEAQPPSTSATGS